MIERSYAGLLVLLRFTIRTRERCSVNKRCLGDEKRNDVNGFPANMNDYKYFKA